MSDTEDPRDRAESDADERDEGADDGEAGGGERAAAPRGGGEAATEPPAHTPSYLFLGVVSVLNLAADLGTKYWAKSRLEDDRGMPKRISILEDHLAFVAARNKGGAWGLLQDEQEAVRKRFFLLISLAAIIFIFSLYRKLTPDQIALKWGLPLVLGGALGNLVDRIRYGYVVDFIDVYATIGGRERHWPTFNVADIAIVVGVGLMAVDMFTSRKPAAAPVKEARAGRGEAAQRD
jgi:signal peptidase II